MTPEQVEQLLALSREAQLTGPDAPTWVERLGAQRDAIVEAIRFLVEHGREDDATELAANTWRLWLITSDLETGREALGAALAAEAAPSRARALVLYGDGSLAFRQGEQKASLKRNEAALEVARAIGDRETESLAFIGLSRVALRDGDYERVRALASKAREAARDLDPSAEALPLHMLAAGTRLAGHLDEAADLSEQGLELYRRLGDRRMVGMELHNLGHLEVHRGNIDRAEQCFAEIAEYRDLDDPYEGAMADLNRAALALGRGDLDDARELLSKTEAALQAAAITLDPDDQFEVDWLRDQLSRGT